MKYVIPFLLCLVFALANVSGQSFYFGPKGGLVIATQQWQNAGQRRALLAAHGDIFIESLENETGGSLYGQLGLHTRGSGIRVFNSFTNLFSSRGFRFNNLSLGLGAKKRLQITEVPTAYYLFGVRAEYTLWTNLSEYNQQGVTSFTPVDVYVRNFMYGVTVGGGFEYAGNDRVQPYIEFAIMPDLSPQYDQFESFTLNNQWTGQPQTFPPQKINNLSFEVTFGLRLLREVIYVD